MRDRRETGSSDDPVHCVITRQVHRPLRIRSDHSRIVVPICSLCATARNAMARSCMLSTRPHVLAALQHGISRDDDLAARTALLKIDPVLRRAARSRLGSVMLDAELAATVAGLDRPPRAHIMKLARSRSPSANRRRPRCRGGDRRVCRAAAREGAPRSDRDAARGDALLAGAGAVAFAIPTRQEPPRVWQRPLPPRPRRRSQGGVPLHDAGDRRRARASR